MNRQGARKYNTRQSLSTHRTAAADTQTPSRPSPSRHAESSRQPAQPRTKSRDTTRILRDRSQSPSWEPPQQDWRDRVYERDLPEQPSYSANLTAEQQEDLRRLFESIDQQGRGVISTRHLATAMANMDLGEPTSEQMSEWVAEVDPKRTGKVTHDMFEEFMARRLDEAEKEDQMLGAFRLFKPGSDEGGITFEDLKQIANHLGEHIPDDELREMINIADTQDTGRVNFDDFARIMLKTGLF